MYDRIVQYLPYAIPLLGSCLIAGTVDGIKIAFCMARDQTLQHSKH